MRILIVGNGGREHALLWKLRRDQPDASFFATRPNGGMAPLCEGVDLAPTDVDALAEWASSQRIDLTVVGPEAPLADGIVDRFRLHGLPVFGPTAAAARIESSKAYAKALMRDAGIPTAEHRTFSSRDDAVSWIRSRGAPIVVKASGLAAGKGAVVCATETEAIGAVDAMLGDMRFGEAGRQVVIEEFMEGEELSVFVLTDGRDVVMLEPSQDHKRVGEGDTGPNTGGMGAYAPVSVADATLRKAALDRIITPTLAALARDGAPFEGLLYAGLMNTADGLSVVEFNCRFGDPETQVVLPLMEGSLLDPIVRIAEGHSLSGLSAPSKPGAAVATVIASEGYPGEYAKGKRITIPQGVEGDDVIVFHAGTALRDGTLLTTGGRVLAVTALAPTVAEAAAASRTAAGKVSFDGAFYRGDIGWKEAERRAAQ
jgi:phosphoribosylamine--glycine ligase